MSTTISVEKLLAKTKIYGQAQFLNLTRNLPEFFAMRIMPLLTLLDSFLKIDLLAKTVNQSHSTEVSQMASLEEKSDIPDSFGHRTQTSLLMHFLYQEFDKPYYTPFPSENTTLKLQNNQISRILRLNIELHVCCGKIMHPGNDW